MGCLFELYSIYWLLLVRCQEGHLASVKKLLQQSLFRLFEYHNYLFSQADLETVTGVCVVT